MFITEQQLALYKYQSNSKYFGNPMAYIAKVELLEYMHTFKAVHNPIELLSHFLNRRVKKDVWVFYFADNSQLAIKRQNDIQKEGILYEFSVFDGILEPFK